MEYLFFVLILILIDVTTKFIVNKKIKINEKIEITKEKFYLTHIKNKGGALGFLKEKRSLLLFFSIITLFSYVYTFIKYKDSFSFGKKTGFLLVFAGGLGNLAERIFKGSVTDFLYFKFKKLPIFNIADFYILFGTIFIVFFNKSIDKK